MKALPGLPLALLLIGVPIAQQIGSVDLTHLPDPPKLAEDLEKRTVPNGCKKLLGGGIADGFVKPEDDRPQDISVEVIKVREMKPAVGSELQAEVQIRNTDTRSIRIPWSTDPSVIENGQNPYEFLWDVGTFEFTLRDQHHSQIRLKSLTRSLYGSKFTAGSQLTIRPGESIAALVKFKLEDEYPIPPGRLKEGKWQLSAEWRQTGRSWHVKNCESWNGYFQYENYYRQQNLAVTIQVTK